MRRRKPSGSEDCKNSATRVCPCWRTSTPTWSLARDTIMRPAPSVPSRKSRSLRASRVRLPAGGKGAANASTDPAAPTSPTAPAAPAGGNKSTTSERPLRRRLYPVDSCKLSTRRRRSPDCTRLADLSRPKRNSKLDRPAWLSMPGKSSAMRAGDCSTKPLGSSLKPCAKSSVTISCPPCMAALSPCRLFCPSAAVAQKMTRAVSMPRPTAAIAASPNQLPVISPSPASAISRCAQPRHRCRPEPALAASLRTR